MFASNASQMRSLHVAEEVDGSGEPCKLPKTPALILPFACTLIDTLGAPGHDMGASILPEKHSCMSAALAAGHMPKQGMPNRMWWCISVL